MQAFGRYPDSRSIWFQSQVLIAIDLSRSRRPPVGAGGYVGRGAYSTEGR